MSVIVTSDVQLLINGNLYAQVASFSFASNTNYKETFALDSPTPYELAPTTTSITGNVQCYRMSGDGGLEGIGATTFFNDFPKQQYITIALRQISTDQIIFRASYCVVTAQSWSMPTKSIITGNFTFRGIIWDNEVASNVA
jgi:hypothetical protein